MLNLATSSITFFSSI